MSEWIGDLFIESEPGREIIVQPTCPYCGVSMEFKQIYDSNGNVVKGIEVVCPLCGHKE